MFFVEKYLKILMRRFRSTYVSLQLGIYTYVSLFIPPDYFLLLKYYSNIQDTFLTNPARVYFPKRNSVNFTP